MPTEPWRFGRSAAPSAWPGSSRPCAGWKNWPHSRPALVVTDAVTRLLPGALGAEGAAERESFASGLLEPPQYTRPGEFRGARVPAVLMSGDHARIARWRRMQALWLTWRQRPDLLERAELTADDRRWIERFELGETPPESDGR